MPILPPTPIAPYDNLNTILNATRLRVNDMLTGAGGEIITDTTPGAPWITQQMANNAWRRLQDILCSLGMARFKNTIILYGFPVTSQTDPGTECWVNWSQYFDGQFYFQPPNCPVLPPDFISPLTVTERPSATFPAVGGNFLRMDRQLNGIPPVPKLFRNWSWQWKDDTLAFPGATVVTDLKLFYEAYLPDFATIGDVPWYNSPVPIARCLDALSWLCAYEACKGRGDMDAESLEQKGIAASRILAERELLQPRSVYGAGELGKGGDAFSAKMVPSQQ